MRCFDFCYTVVNLNTTFSFVDYCIKNGENYLKFRLFIIKVVSKLLLMLRFINANQHSKLRLRALKGLKSEELRKFSKQFSLELERNINPEIFSILNSDKDRKVLVVSNALDFVIRDFFRYMDIKCDVVGSRIDLDGLIFTGNYCLYLPDVGKVSALFRTHPNILISEFYTDDFIADGDLVNYSEVSYLVCEGHVV